MQKNRKVNILLDNSCCKNYIKSFDWATFPLTAIDGYSYNRTILFRYQATRQNERSSNSPWGISIHSTLSKLKKHVTFKTPKLCCGRYLYVYIYRARERKRERERGGTKIFKLFICSFIYIWSSSEVVSAYDPKASRAEKRKRHTLLTIKTI